MKPEDGGRSFNYFIIRTIFKIIEFIRLFPSLICICITVTIFTHGNLDHKFKIFHISIDDRSI